MKSVQDVQDRNIAEDGLSEWDEEAFRRRVRERAAELEMPMDAVLRASRVHRAVLHRDGPSHTISTLERLAEALKWTLPEIMGFETRLDVEISAVAISAAETVIERLPTWARTQENFVEAHASLYDLLSGRKRDGQLPESVEGRSEIVEHYVEMLVRAWRGRPQPSPSVGSAPFRPRFPQRARQPS